VLPTDDWFWPVRDLRLVGTARAFAHRCIPTWPQIPRKFTRPSHLGLGAGPNPLFSSLRSIGRVGSIPIARSTSRLASGHVGTRDWDQDKNHLVIQVALDGDAERRFGGPDVIGRRCGISMHERCTGNYPWPTGAVMPSSRPCSPAALACLSIGFIVFSL
jgi:hypothetical protein